MYIDPGTGSMLIQALIAAFPVLGAVIIAFRKSIFGGKGKSAKGTEQTDQTTTTPQNDDFEVIDDEQQ